MKYAIDETFEKLLLDGCRIISADSATFNYHKGEITHILLECPKDYKKGTDERPVTFLTLEIVDKETGGWYVATTHYGNRPHTVKYYRQSLAEDRAHYLRMKELENANK